jgi:hypothetical protein
LIGCRVGHACPWALPADISPNSRTSARHELRRIAFSSGERAVVRVVRADYVAEAGSTQIGNLHRQSHVARIYVDAAEKIGLTGVRSGLAKATPQFAVSALRPES